MKQKDFWEIAGINTAVDCLNYNSVSIAKMKKYSSNEAVSAFLTLGIIDLIQGFNVGKTMNAQQVNFMIETIKQDYYYLKPEELKYCFNNAKKGAYGQLYDRIDSAIICDWIEKYLAERNSLYEQKNINEQKEYGREVMHHSIATKLKGLFKEEIKEPKQIEVRQKTEEEILIQDILKEFDSLYSNAPITQSAIRTIEYLGQQITVEQFLEIRLTELNKL